MNGKGLITTVEFEMAHFKVHTTMKGRTTYLLPLPSTIIGFFFSMMGFTRETFVQRRNEFLSGAQIVDLKGISRENAQLLKLKPSKLSKIRKKVKEGRQNEIKKDEITRTTEEITILFHPVYKFVIWGAEDFIKTLSEKIKNYDFTFVPYGGISDFIFWDVKDSHVIEKLSSSDEFYSSYAPHDTVKSPRMSGGGVIYSFPYLSEGIVKKVIMTYKTSLILKVEVPTVEGIPIYKVPLEVMTP